HGLPAAPVLVVKLDVFRIFLSHRDARHAQAPSWRAAINSCSTASDLIRGKACLSITAAAAAVGAAASSRLVAARFVDLLVELASDARRGGGELGVVQLAGRGLAKVVANLHGGVPEHPVHAILGEIFERIVDQLEPEIDLLAAAFGVAGLQHRDA